MVDDKERQRLINTIRALANGLVLSIFFSFYNFFRMTGRDTVDAQIILWASFIVVLFGVNILVYYTYEKKPPNSSKEPQKGAAQTP